MRRTPEDRRAFAIAAAENLRLNMTAAERKLWMRLEPLGFKAQWPVFWTFQRPPVILDFYSPAKNLCVEVDGGYHRRQRGRDRRRDTRLRVEMGIETMRFTNAEIERDIEAVVAKICRAIGSLPERAIP